MQIGIDSFVETTVVAGTGLAPSPTQRVANLLEEMALADQVGLDVYGIGEHHREEYVASAPAVLLAAGAARTKNLRLTSAVTVLSSDDPVRLFQQFATVDLISGGRAEMVVGRGSFVESYPLFGYDLENYDEMFAEKLGLLLKLRTETKVQWKGEYRPSLTGQGVYPRPAQEVLPVWLGVGGSMNSFMRAGKLGLPLMIAIIGGEPHRFRLLVETYRDAWRRAGHPGEPKVGIHALGFVADSMEEAADLMFPAYARSFNKIGKERGWPPTTREHFDASRSPRGALVVGDKDTVAEKIFFM